MWWFIGSVFAVSAIVMSLIYCFADKQEDGLFDDEIWNAIRGSDEYDATTVDSDRPSRDRDAGSCETDERER